MNELNPSDAYKLNPPSSRPFKTWKGSEKDPKVSIGDPVTKLGYEFYWTEFHLKGSQLDTLRFLSDDLCDRVLEEGQFKPQEDVLSIVLERAKEEGGVYKEFLDSVATPPSWVDMEKVKIGQKLYLRNSIGSANALLYLSLVGGFGAPKINKVLTSTGYLANKNTFTRLLETSQMIIDCMEPDGLVPYTGIGWISSLKVRFLHGKVRQRLKKSTKWNEEEWGIPINQEDMAVTQLSFSFNVLFALYAMGIKITDEEAEAYIHLWRYIGFLSGVREEVNPCKSFKQARGFLESVVMHILEPDDSSKLLSHHVVRSLQDPRNPVQVPLAFHYQMSRLLMGEELANLLELPSSFFWKIHHLVTFRILRVSSFLTYLPIIGDFLINRNRLFVRKMVKQGLKGEASFGLSHVPSDSTINNLDWLKDERPNYMIRSSPFNNVVVFLITLYFLQKIFSSKLLVFFLKKVTLK